MNRWTDRHPLLTRLGAAVLALLATRVLLLALAGAGLQGAGMSPVAALVVWVATFLACFGLALHLLRRY